MIGKKKKKIEEYTKQMMHNAIAHPLPTDALSVPEQQPPPLTLPQFIYWA